MKSLRLTAVLTSLVALSCATGPTAAPPAPPATTAASIPAPAAPAVSGLTVPVDYYKLPNGLKVVLSPDTTAPTATVAV